MGDLSLHFSKSEFECPCGCGFDEVSADEIFELERLRLLLGGVPIRVSVGGGCRCAAYNKTIRFCNTCGVNRRKIKCPVCGKRTKQRSSITSQHKKGTAADVSVRGVTPSIVARKAEECGFKGIGIYKWGVHLDMRRGRRARWDRR